MGEGLIVRKGGVVTEQALAPTITEVSTTDSSITFTITNNDASTAVILYEVGDATPDANSIELAAAATSSNITITGLTGGTEYTVSATASVTGKVLSNVASLAIETDPPIVYTAATGGTTLEYDLDGKRYKSHTFTSNGTFTVTTVGDAIDDINKVDYLIIAGGGGTGSNGSKGGGAGGYRTTLGTSGGNSSAESKVTVTATSYSIVVGAGGNGTGRSFSTPGTNGSSSSALGISTTGGGTGSYTAELNNGGSSGGSGGGRHSGAAFAGVSGQGHAGGVGLNSGGGGAGSVGINAGATERSGGNGLSNTLRTGIAETRAGGGGGPGGTVGGSGGGGNGGNNTTAVDATAGTVNTGSGGGGSRFSEGAGAAGGSGIVVIRYEIAPSV